MVVAEKRAVVVAPAAAVGAVVIELVEVLVVVARERG